MDLIQRHVTPEGKSKSRVKDIIFLTSFMEKRREDKEVGGGIIVSGQVEKYYYE